MILTIALKELMEMSRDRRLRIMALVVYGLLAAALLIGWLQAGSLRRQQEAAKAQTWQNWLNQGSKTPHSAAHFGIYAHKPVSILSLFDPGVDPYTGVTIWLEAHKQNDALYRPARDQNALARLSPLTAASVFELFLPLLVILMTFHAFTGEKESGTLKQLLALGVERWEIAIGKLIGVLFAVLILVVPAVLLSVVLVLLAAGTQPQDDALTRIVTLGLLYSAYVATFAFLGVGVSALAPNSRLALGILLGLWLVNGLAGPRWAADWANRAAPLPTASQFQDAVRHDLENGFDFYPPPAKRKQMFREHVLLMYRAKSMEELPVSFAGLALLEDEQFSNAVWDRHFPKLWDRMQQQATALQDLSWLLPSLAMRSVSMGLCGTDPAHHISFSAAAEKYRRNLVYQMNTSLANRGAGKDMAYRADRKLWESLPRFHWDGPSTDQILNRNQPALAAVPGWLILSIAFAIVASLRVQPLD
ncbi:MAG: DUF3526 domain-containing protein [Bryobacter sp.]|nr:DUF3526 domain-containing protein [Bryobacter sp.]